MRGLGLHEQAFEEDPGPSVPGAISSSQHVEGQLKLFGNRKRDGDLAAADLGDGETAEEELQLT
jgi:hypothetical protein